MGKCAPIAPDVITCLIPLLADVTKTDHVLYVYRVLLWGLWIRVWELVPEAIPVFDSIPEFFLNLTLIL